MANMSPREPACPLILPVQISGATSVAVVTEWRRDDTLRFYDVSLDESPKDDQLVLRPVEILDASTSRVSTFRSP